MKKISPAASHDGPRAAVDRNTGPRCRQKQPDLQTGVRDTGEPAPVAAGVLLRSAGTGKPPANETNAAQPLDRPGCNTGSAGGRDKRNAHSPSADNAAAALRGFGAPEAPHPLDPDTNNQHAEMGPREGSLPTGQVSERSVNSSPRRYQIDPPPSSSSRLIPDPLARHTPPATPPPPSSGNPPRSAPPNWYHSRPPPTASERRCVPGVMLSYAFPAAPVGGPSPGDEPGSGARSIASRVGSQSVPCLSIDQATTAILRAKATAAFLRRFF